MRAPEGSGKESEALWGPSQAAWHLWHQSGLPPTICTGQPGPKLWMTLSSTADLLPGSRFGSFYSNLKAYGLEPPGRPISRALASGDPLAWLAEMLKCRQATPKRLGHMRHSQSCTQQCQKGPESNGFRFHFLLVGNKRQGGDFLWLIIL